MKSILFMLIRIHDDMDVLLSTPEKKKCTRQARQDRTYVGHHYYDKIAAINDDISRILRGPAGDAGSSLMADDEHHNHVVPEPAGGAGAALVYPSQAKRLVPGKPPWCKIAEVAEIADFFSP